MKVCLCVNKPPSNNCGPAYSSHSGEAVDSPQRKESTCGCTESVSLLGIAFKGCFLPRDTVSQCSLDWSKACSVEYIGATSENVE